MGDLMQLKNPKVDAQSKHSHISSHDAQGFPTEEEGKKVPVTENNWQQSGNNRSKKGPSKTY